MLDDMRCDLVVSCLTDAIVPEKMQPINLIPHSSREVPEVRHGWCCGAYEVLVVREVGESSRGEVKMVFA